MTAKTAQYKGRTYRLAYLGDTKFGRRAKLQYFDGSKEFWVDASLVSVASAPSYARRGRVRSCCGHTSDECADLDCTCRVCGGMMG